VTLTISIEVTPRAGPKPAGPAIINVDRSLKDIKHQHVKQSRGEKFSCMVHVCREVKWNLIPVLFKKLMVTQTVKKFLHIMKRDCSLPCSQQPASGLTASVYTCNPSFCNIRLCVLAQCGNGLRRFRETAYADTCRFFTIPSSPKHVSTTQRTTSTSVAPMFKFHL